MSGLFDGPEMAANIIIKVDNAYKALICGDRLGFTVGYVEVMQMLVTLKKGMEEEQKQHAKELRALRAQLERANDPGSPEGGIIGGERFEFGTGAHGETEADAVPHVIPFDAENKLGGAQSGDG